ncbi:aldehyde reductase [Bradyrhizobium sp. AS23.2]|uniref:SDR family oxidoreductase n=1 Tax=Bradyrhizobium sp. AS23.2 TaxID=1680155 RepID=UPI000A9E6BCC|nr:aldehyde reductase [Bradyrhizobium sp. AS23.2]
MTERKSTTVLVTGIGGFVAGHIAQQLLDQGYAIRGTVRRMDSASRIAARVCRQAPADEARIEFVKADLCQDAGWAQAAAGCDYVIHTASPFPAGLPDHEDDLVVPARDGALRVLRAARDARVKRVVMTSSIAATNHGSGTAPFTETDWTDPDGPRATPYYKAKTLAERAAWDFASSCALDLAVINPGMIFGPLSGANFGTSIGLLLQLMNGKFTRLPRFGFPVVDVRDVADAHIKAMTHPAASGQRFLVAGKFLWLKDVSDILARAFPDYASRLPTGEIPDWLVRVMALISPMSRMIVHELGRDLSVDSSKARRLLAWRSRDEAECICAGVQSLINLKLIEPMGKGS